MYNWESVDTEERGGDAQSQSMKCNMNRETPGHDSQPIGRRRSKKSGGGLQAERDEERVIFRDLFFS